MIAAVIVPVAPTAGLISAGSKGGLSFSEVAPFVVVLLLLAALTWGLWRLVDVIFGEKKGERW